MHEVQVDAVDPGLELRPGVEDGFLPAPVVLVRPVGDQLLEVSEVGAVVPAGAGDLVRPACPLETVLEVQKHGLIYIDPKWLRCQCRPHSRPICVVRRESRIRSKSTPTI